MGASLSKKKTIVQTWPQTRIDCDTHICNIEQKNGESIEYMTDTIPNTNSEIKLFDNRHKQIAQASYKTNTWRPGPDLPVVAIINGDHTCKLTQKNGTFLQYDIIHKPDVVPNLNFYDDKNNNLETATYCAFPSTIVASQFDCTCQEENNEMTLYDDLCVSIDLYEQVLTENLKSVVNNCSNFPPFVIDHAITTIMKTILKKRDLFLDSAVLCTQFSWCELMMMLSLRNGLLNKHNSVNQKYNMIYDFEHSIRVFQHITSHGFDGKYETMVIDIYAGMIDTVGQIVNDLLYDKQANAKWKALWCCKDQDMSLRNYIRIAEKFLSIESTTYGYVGAYIIMNALQH